jgi:uridylate kinase
MAHPLNAILAVATALGSVLAAGQANPALSAPAGSATSPQQAATYVLLNGTVHTVNQKQPWAQAVAVRADRIVYVGSNQGARAFIGKDTRAP